MASNNEEGKIALASEGATPANDIDPSLVTTGSPVEGGCVYTSFKANPTLPTDAVAKISTLTDLVSLGDLSQDGFTASKSVTVNEFKGWHQSIVLTKVSEEKHQYKMVFIESVRLLRRQAAIRRRQRRDERGRNVQPHQGHCQLRRARPPRHRRARGHG